MSLKTFCSTVFFFICIVVSCYSQTEQIPVYSKVKIYTPNHSTIHTLQELGIDLICGAIHNKKDGYIELVLSNYERKLLNSKRIKYDIMIEDVSKQRESQLKKALPKAKKLLQEKKNKNSKNNPGQDSGCVPSEYLIPNNFKLGTMGGAYTYEEYIAQLDSMHNLFPNLISEKDSLSSTVTTIEGRPVYYVRISDNPEIDEDESEVLYTALHHAREPSSMMSLIYFMWYVLENYDSDVEVKNLLDNVEMYFVPMLNPDGYIYNESTNPNGGGFWRKNRRQNSNGSFGVDLNRNYSYNWGLNNIGSSGNPSSNTYRGTAPFSEPETAMLRDFIYAHDFKVVVNNHSFSEYVIYPFGIDADYVPEPDADVFHTLCEHMSRMNRYYYGPTHFVIYETNGEANDWAYGEQTEKDKIFGFTPEIGSIADGGFWPDPNIIEQLCQDQLHTLFTAAYGAGAYAILHDNTSISVQNITDELHFSLEQVSTLDESFSIRIIPLSQNILSSDTLIHTSILLGNEFEEITCSYELNPNISPGELIEFELVLNNGSFDIHKMTLKKYFQMHNLIQEVHEDNTLEIWNGNWILSPEESYSGNYSITENIGDNNSGTHILTLNESINLSDVNFAKVEFFTKYSIQHQFDYVKCEVSTDSIVWESLCGKHTKSGSASDITGHPISLQNGEGNLYDANMKDWVREELDLSAYIGEETLYLRFYSFNDANAYAHLEGFYLDNFKVIVDPIGDCNDGTRNGSETAIDCGGWSCDACPDVVTSFVLLPSTVVGQQEQIYVLSIQEINDVSTNQTITIALPKDSKLTIDWQENLSSLENWSLDNASWLYDDTHPSFHIWQYNGVLDSSSNSSLGFFATYSPNVSSGIAPFTATLISGSGGESNSSNNIDVETLNYFSN